MTLLGKDGKARVSLMLDGGDSPIIQMSDAAGRHQLSLDVREGIGPAIALRDTERDSGVVLTSDRTGVAALGFIGEHARSQIELGINPDGSVALTLYDKEGKVVFSTPRAAKDAP
ncbi:MAG: hypothetical protein P4L85_27960 [Paludisphaera borealis]|uniref:hypothetical protein n=1 Tax=Paludisphaera borealis TaxID=1387353 RepID=UPI0028457BD4|nr:hypothetical protein [Paludisphaera borealis]MDR3623221.1 hypothetical protein [Paludisphaera borealis]